MEELLKCPYCGGYGKVSIRQLKYYGQNEIGWKKIKYGAQGICNSCHARGGLATKIIFDGRQGWFKTIRELEEQATELWNRRV